MGYQECADTALSWAALGFTDGDLFAVVGPACPSSLEKSGVALVM